MDVKRGLAALLAIAALALAACGGDDEPEATNATSGTTGAQGAAGSEMTVEEFIAELQPQKKEILEGLVAELPECEGVEADNGFVLLVSAAAIDADQDAPLTGLVAEQC